MINRIVSDKMKIFLLFILFISACKQSTNQSFKGQHWNELADSFGEMHLIEPTLKDKLQVDIVTYGTGGSCIANGYDDAEGDGIHRLSFIERLPKSFLNKPDCVLLVTGGNDWNYNVPIGKLSDTVKTTYFGALNFIAQQAKTMHQKMIWITMIKRNTTTKIGKIKGVENIDSQKQYKDAMLLVGKNNKIMVIDEFDNSGISFFNSRILTKDGAHPNWLGKKIYSNSIIDAILYQN